MLPANRAFNSNGIGVPGAVARLYQSGTTTPANFYSDTGLSVSLGSSITANAAGRFPTAYGDDAIAYRLIVEDDGGVELDDVDPFYFGTVEAASTTAAAASATAAAASATNAASSASSASTSATNAAASATAAAEAAADVNALEWINIRTTATGASQNIALYEAKTADQVFLYANGSHKIPAVDFTASGSTVNTTQTAGQTILARYLGSVEPPVAFSRVVFGWNGTAGLDSARFGSFCKISETTGLIAYSPRHSSVNDGEIGMRLDVVSYTLDIANETLTLGSPVTVETPSGFTSGTGAAWAGQLLRLSTGRILLFYMFLNSPDGTYTHADSRMDICLRYSDDGGATWSAKTTIAPGETAYASFGVADYNAASAGLNIAGGTNHVVQLPSGRIVLTGYLLGAASHYLASIYSDNSGSTWSFGTPLAMAANYNEPSVALTDTGLAAFVRNEASNGRGVFYSTNGQTWAFDRLDTTAAIRNVASCAYRNSDGKILVGGATTVGDNRKGWKLFPSTDEGESFAAGYDALFDGTLRIGYSFLSEIADGYYGLLYEVTNTQTTGSFNAKSSLCLAVFNDMALAAAEPAIRRLPDSLVYVAATENTAYTNYVTGDGGTIQDAAAVLAAITAAINGDYYSSIGFAVSARWGHKNLGAAGQKLYSLNRIKNDLSEDVIEWVRLDTTTFAYATAKFPNGSWLQFNSLKLRDGDTMGCVVMDKAASTSATAGISVQWTDGALHYFWPAGVAINGESSISNGPTFVTDNLKAYHFFLDCDARQGIAGYDGTNNYAVGYYPGTIAEDETANVKIIALGSAAERFIPELWFFNGPNLTAEMVRQCGADVGGRY